MSRLDCYGKSELRSSGFLGCSQAVESNEFFIFHSLGEATEIHGQPEFLSPFLSP
jgi:hypothetical protein